jgi:hypothetical protein
VSYALRPLERLKLLFLQISKHRGFLHLIPGYSVLAMAQMGKETLEVLTLSSVRKKVFLRNACWLTPVILATREEEIRRITS